MIQSEEIVNVLPIYLLRTTVVSVAIAIAVTLWAWKRERQSGEECAEEKRLHDAAASDFDS